MEETLELLMRRVDEIEKRLEKYYQMLKTDNELDFIKRGTYLTEEDIEKIKTGNY